ncbi:RHS repeat-associated core domain-containing protein [Winogradskyella sp.]|uniref:RHS repeat domain-containing protein n=1 Tax=Winogradskyella sp. TaxID=1883156 RepID=UPI00262885C4|nr:RHS repeat-associated core domain-containing protein [Winogradskyella sp.]
MVLGYYPFGLKYKGYNDVVSANVNSVAQRWKFQGQEHQDDLGLGWIQFKWRMHDPAVGRFISIDPLAEDYVHNGVYNFSENRVIDGIELEGLEWEDFRVRQKEERLARGERTTKTEVAVGAGLAALGVASVATVVYGFKAVGTFLLKEAVEEGVSQATGGLSDFVDLGKLAKSGIELGIKKIKSHLSNPDLNLDPDMANDVMLDDLQKIANGEMEPTDIHNDYFNHEIRESEHVANGMDYDAAHSQTIKDQGIDPSTSQSRLYTQEAVKKGDEAFEEQVNNELKKLD